MPAELETHRDKQEWFDFRYLFPGHMFVLDPTHDEALPIYVIICDEDDTCTAVFRSYRPDGFETASDEDILEACCTPDKKIHSIMSRRPKPIELDGAPNIDLKIGHFCSMGAN